ncbi:aldo/keto reductase [Microbacterium saperdae]|uniref:Aryl-alcohol dehydrogenase-like predicted oxidoreductase n=1 Tax=Microbacterium saperdae TaxID=69368 RepID=A0A543BQ41_9MICO|nr:aldo/keto reductase [Microbacterium saperdae]TQL86908.1 aryl-alcohol dehydrogenase-like predicted oxidoreductase [Microbacterium saperdae]GGM44403.1 aldo/keto reductase [Microbacterium saperdae]
MTMPTTLPLPRREIGRSGIPASLFSLGSWHTYDRMDFADAVAMLRQAVDRGVNLFDVGVYSAPGMPPVFTDIIFSAMVRAAGLRREDWLLSSKLWLESFGADGFRPQLENALLRVGVEHADLVILGDLRRDDLDLRDLVLDLAQLADAGLIRAWGVNNWSASSIQRLIDIAAAEGVAGPQIAQLKYSVARRAIPDGEPFARLWEQGLTLQASDCLEGGVLAGTVAGDRQIGRDPGDIRTRIIADVPAFTELAASLDVSPAQLGIAFTLTHPALTTTLFGASRIEQLHANLDAAALVDRVGATELRRLVEPFWTDRGIVDPEGP